MTEYRYQFSLGSDSIRLLCLLPNEDEAAPIQCRLHNYPLRKLEKGPQPYEALSYVWGDSGMHKSVLIDGYTVPVTMNLYAALSRLRDRTFERIIGADSVCINQADEREKERQIPLMSRIYG